MTTKDQLDVLRKEALKRCAEYMEAEKKLWDSENGFADLTLYKAYKKAKSNFHTAIEHWETAFAEYAFDRGRKNSNGDAI